MPKNTAQWTGFAVTVIIVLGRDADVLTAVPLGIAAGMLAPSSRRRCACSFGRCVWPPVDRGRLAGARCPPYRQCAHAQHPDGSDAPSPI